MGVSTQLTLIGETGIWANLVIGAIWLTYNFGHHVGVKTTCLNYGKGAGNVDRVGIICLLPALRFW